MAGLPPEVQVIGYVAIAGVIAAVPVVTYGIRKHFELGKAALASTERIKVAEERMEAAKLAAEKEIEEARLIFENQREADRLALQKDILALEREKIASAERIAAMENGTEITKNKVNDNEPLPDDRTPESDARLTSKDAANSKLPVNSK